VASTLTVGSRLNEMVRAIGLLIGALVLFSAPLAGDEVKKADLRTFQVPYRLSDVNHVVVRVKLNGKGPFNFVVDTGAPFLFIFTDVAKQAGVDPDKDGRGTFDRFEIEGGIVIEKAKSHIDNLARMEAANSLGVLGVPIHGLMGYDVLAHYKIELDCTRPKMTWTRLDFKPPPGVGLKAKGSEPADVDAVAKAMKLVGSLLGSKPPELRPRGFLGIELADRAGGVVVQTVLPQGPAATAGLKPNDRITQFQDKKVQSTAEVFERAARLSAGDAVIVKVRRGDETHTITIKAGRGL
jgi:membrane-associated protease RseP (regulator of RpoE activity)